MASGPIHSDAEFFTLLLRSANRFEPRLRRRLLATWRDLRTKVDLPTLETLVETRNVDGILAILALEEIAPGVRPVSTRVIRQVVDAAGRLAARRLTSLLGVDVPWDALSRRARQWALRHGGELITDLVEQSRLAIRGLVIAEFDLPLSIPQTARLIQSAVGLNKVQAAALRNFAHDLVSRGFTEKQVARLTRIYANRLARHRATMIARTETMSAANAAQRELWREASAKGVFAADEWLREWVGILRDGHICQTCHRLHGQRAPIHGRFPNGMVGPIAHVACRCSERLVRPEDAEFEKPPFVQSRRGGTLRPLVEKKPIAA